MTELASQGGLFAAWLAVAALVFVVLLFLPAPYGRHARAGWGPVIPARPGWILMEIPAVLVVAVLFAASGRTREPVAIAFLLLWELHYVQRALVYPFRARHSARGMPLAVAAMGFLFNVVNGALQGTSLFLGEPVRGAAWLGEPRFLAGTALFLGGMALNWSADATLRRLRRPGSADYGIPRGGPFELVSCPNYLGEIVEWAGWALATWSPAGLAFALWTAANLVPRALAHHRWYRERFPGYPARRRAIVPFLL
ncbi:MAG: 3-oxo-5-alpha-steroid 4-dehydrogenase [Acidobacteria bacterium]|nr:3-oxo-5-alpha-steroid 4-dehydrogenase [Acidobacteriota bacterium]